MMSRLVRLRSTAFWAASCVAMNLPSTIDVTSIAASGTVWGNSMSNISDSDPSSCSTGSPSSLPIPHWDTSLTVRATISSSFTIASQPMTGKSQRGGFDLGQPVLSLPMSCVVITPDMSYLLDALRAWPVSPEVLAQLREMPECAQAREWGWVTASGELTGTGSRHAGDDSPKGITDEAGRYQS